MSKHREIRLNWNRKTFVDGYVVVKHPSGDPEIRHIKNPSDIFAAYGELGGTTPEEAVDTLGEIEFNGKLLFVMCRVGWRDGHPNVLWPEKGVVCGPVLVTGGDAILDEEFARKIALLLESWKVPSGTSVFAKGSA